MVSSLLTAQMCLRTLLAAALCHRFVTVLAVNEPLKECKPAQQENDDATVDPPRLLIGMVSGSSPQTMARVVSSMRYMAEEEGFFPAWMIALYKGSMLDWGRVFAKAQKLKVRVKVYDARDGRHCPFCPKLQFQLEFARRAAKFDFVWLADEDMSFANFSMRTFWEFHGKWRPLIAQPTIRQHTQYDFFHNIHDEWVPCADWLKSVRTTFVEQQTTVFESRFFGWLAPRLAELAHAQQKMGSDWGADLVWCGAAKIYSDLYHLSNPPCAIVLVPQDHLNSHGITKTKEYINHSYALLGRLERRDFKDSTNKIVDAIADLCKESAASDDPFFLQNNFFDACKN